MPTRKATTAQKAVEEKTVETKPVVEEVVTVEKEVEEFNLEKKVTVRSIAEWTTGFQRIETNGDVTIPPNGTVRLSRGEIISQVQNGNVLFTGMDGQGSHATLYIEDKPTRIEADFETEDSPQNVINEDRVKDLFNTKSNSDFEAILKNMVVTRAEKYAIIGIIKKFNFNDYNKVRAVEDYTKLRV